MKKKIWLITIGVVLLFVFLQIRHEPHHTAVDSAGVLEQNGDQITEQQKADEGEHFYSKSPYKIADVFSGEVKNDIELMIADDKYSLIKTADFAQLFYLKVEEKDNQVILGDGRIIFTYGETFMKGYVVDNNGTKRYALYKIPFPAVKIDGVSYVPLRTAARAMGYGVRWIGDVIYLGKNVSVDDINLVFVKYID